MYSEPTNFITFVVPVFMLGIVVELLLARRRGLRAYRIGPAVSDLGCGILSQVAELFLRGAALWVFAWVYDHGRLLTFDGASPWPWVIGFVGVDLGFYWWHRASHVIGSLWAVHGVHHQSEDFNLAVALRQPAFESLTAIPFYLPLALLGVDPVTFAACYAANLSYQFFTHTELVRRLGPLEWVLNTPSHHRVHHGINPRYLDRNYAGVFILWDRMFGTFQEEDEPVVYGVTEPLRNLDPVWANFDIFAHIARVARGARGIAGRLWAFVAHPAWRPDGPPKAPAPVSRATFERYDPHPPLAVARYVIVHLVLALAQSAALTELHAAGASWAELVLPSAVLVVGLVALTDWIEGRRRAPFLDLARQLATPVAVYLALAPRVAPPVATGVALGTAALLLAVALVFRPWTRGGQAVPSPA